MNILVADFSTSVYKIHLHSFATINKLSDLCVFISSIKAYKVTSLCLQAIYKFIKLKQACLHPGAISHIYFLIIYMRCSVIYKLNSEVIVVRIVLLYFNVYFLVLIKAGLIIKMVILLSAF